MFDVVWRKKKVTRKKQKHKKEYEFKTIIIFLYVLIKRVLMKSSYDPRISESSFFLIEGYYSTFKTDNSRRGVVPFVLTIFKRVIRLFFK